MNIGPDSFRLPFDPIYETRLDRSIDQILSMGGRINTGYDEGTFVVPVPFFEGYVRGTYQIIEDRYLDITIEETPEGMTADDIRSLCIEQIGLENENEVVFLV